MGILATTLGKSWEYFTHIECIQDICRIHMISGCITIIIIQSPENSSNARSLGDDQCVWFDVFIYIYDT